ncbi:hypothetical protein Taro_049107 [Colocasia esculenta]|uniref:Golgin candidate 2 n=1 Tax=Colocasia esculenta TaxID=4460 RepID=A0A843X9Z9_COLES|nr:hypothetical protein [Colocasia esculenta]
MLPPGFLPSLSIHRTPPFARDKDSLWKLSTIAESPPPAVTVPFIAPFFTLGLIGQSSMCPVHLFRLKGHTAGPLQLLREGERERERAPPLLHTLAQDQSVLPSLHYPDPLLLYHPVMAGWISSKLKIDQQAADSLGNGERGPSPPPLVDDGDGALRKKAETLPLKLQLHKKPPERGRHRDGGPRPKGNPNSARNPPARAPSLPDPPRTSTSLLASVVSPGAAAAAAPSDADAAAAMDGDWTKLLSSPKPVSPIAGGSGGSSPSPRSKKKVGVPKRRSNNRPGREVETSQAVENEEGMPSARDEGADSTVRRLTGGGIVLSAVSVGSSGSTNSGKGGSLGESPSDMNVLVPEPTKDMGDKSRFGTNDEVISSEARQKEGSVPKDDGLTGDDVTVSKGRTDADSAEINDVEDKTQSIRTLQTSPPRSLSRISSRSSGSSGSYSGSTSTSDSEYESEKKMERRKRRERILAEKAAAVAAEAIKERENLVARLEGEKESLEKVLEERQKQQAQEASELQMSMMETMEAVELEKQKHNSTRMEALACLAQLETRNAELAKSLATAQWDLEVEMEASKQGEYEHKIIEAELSFICDKIVQLKEKARSLERNIEMTKELVHPTEVETELKKRLKQLTDNLIQKQAQVETFSSEKATLLFRIETISRFLEENGMSVQSGSTACSGLSSSESSARIDIEAGTGEPSYSTLRPLFREKINSGGQQLGSFLRQLDAIFAAGSLFLRKNQMAQLWALVYLVCLHLWVIYILMSHSQTSDVTSSGAVFSLENINKTVP